MVKRKAAKKLSMKNNLEEDNVTVRGRAEGGEIKILSLYPFTMDTAICLGVER